MHLLISMPPDVASVQPSYFCATTGSVSMDTVKSYIEAQRTEEHKRKYVKSGKYKRAIHPTTD